jgi:hypothetical protein
MNLNETKGKEKITSGLVKITQGCKVISRLQDRSKQ